MRIIKKGKARSEELFVGECKQCGCRAEARRDELNIEYDQRENGEFGRGTCPDHGCKDMIFYPKSRS